MTHKYLLQSTYILNSFSIDAGLPTASLWCWYWGGIVMKFLKALSAIALALSIATPAFSAVVVRTYDFVATDFRALGPPVVPPFANVTGSFTLTFDDAASAFQRTDGIVLNSLSIPHGTLFSYSFAPNAPLIFDVRGPQSLFFIAVGSAASSTPSFINAAYSLPNSPGFFNGFSGRVSLRTGAVPEPATWSLLIVGFGIVGAAARRRRALARQLHFG
jgi:hypothetical protein